MRVFKRAWMQGNQIWLFTADDEVNPEERRIKTGKENSIWSQSFERNFLKQGDWIEDGKMIRAGLSIMPIIVNRYGKNVTILIKFNPEHPTAANKWSPPAGLWDKKISIRDGALEELGEEVIIQDLKGKIGYWVHDGEILTKEWVDRYKTENDIGGGDLTLKVCFIQNNPSLYEIYIDNEFQGQADVTAEFDTGSIEIIFPVLVEGENEFMLLDGEYFNGWLDRKINFFSKEDIENMPLEKLTTKAIATKILFDKI